MKISRIQKLESDILLWNLIRNVLRHFIDLFWFLNRKLEGNVKIQNVGTFPYVIVIGLISNTPYGIPYAHQEWSLIWETSVSHDQKPNK